MSDNRIDIANGKYWDRALSLVKGCTPVSEACEHCWLAAMEHRFNAKTDEAGRAGLLTNFKGNFNGTVRTREDRLDIPLRTRKPTVFAVWSDLFHEAVPTRFIERALNVMYEARRHTFIVLTKRPKRMADFLLGTSGAGANFEFGNVYWGTTIENQEQLSKRVLYLQGIPGKHVVSAEPLLGELNFTNWDMSYIQAVIVGGESGKGARPMHPDWVRSIRDQCAAAGVQFFFKQWGEWWPGAKGRLYRQRTIDWSDGQPMVFAGKKAAGRILDGRTHDDLPWAIC